MSKQQFSTVMSQEPKRWTTGKQVKNQLPPDDMEWVEQQLLRGMEHAADDTVRACKVRE